MLWRWMSTWKLTSSNRKWSKMANAQTFPFAIASNINDITLMLHELINVMLNYRLKSLTNIIEQVEISKMATLIIPIQSSIAIWNFTSELMPSQATFQTDLIFEKCLLHLWHGNSNGLSVHKRAEVGQRIDKTVKFQTTQLGRSFPFETRWKQLPAWATINNADD